LVQFLQSAGRDLLIVATKTDKLSANKLRSALARLGREHGVDGVLAYSSKTGAGRAELWRAIRARMAK
jgi:GTP-binding protein EngB required for normal cell division